MKLNDGRQRRCHQDQVRRRTVNLESPSPGGELSAGLSLEDSDVLPDPVAEPDESEVPHSDPMPNPIVELKLFRSLCYEYCCRISYYLSGRP